ncbi:MAG: hypothetical protein D6761_02015 [Candidatus Dadabacteria bacterium]|nr:MAG: hypothetical protein D6761_02015 [Candidatus Dadabacteria bacterium]
MAFSMDSLPILDPEFVELNAPHQNEALEPLLRSRRLMPMLSEAVAELPWDPESPEYQDIWLGLAALHLFEKRIERALFKPLIRVFLRMLAEYRAQEVQPPEYVESFAEIWSGVGLPENLIDHPTQAWQQIVDAIITQAGPGDWERAMAFVQAARRLSGTLPDADVHRLIAIALLIVLGSRPQRKPLAIWRDIWNRTTFEASDLFYHDSRLRRALLDENIDHAYHLIAVMAKSGETSSDLLAAIIRAAYDIDYASERRTLGLIPAASALLESAPLLTHEQFRRGLARLLWDLAFEEKRDPERIFYDEISLIKSREIEIDFRRAVLRSDFIQSWGYAEYAFVHGFEADQIFVILSQLSPSFYRGGTPLLWAWSHLASIETLLRLLPEENGIYVMAHTVRLLSRTPKDTSLLDPFPDEDQ